MVKPVGSYKGVSGFLYVRCTGAEYVSFLRDSEIWPQGRFIIQMVNRIDSAWMSDDLMLDDILPTAVVEISNQGGVADDHSLSQWGMIDYFNDWKNSSR